jgi:hypothetical protein
MRPTSSTKTSRKISTVVIRFGSSLLVSMGVASIVASLVRAEAQGVFPAGETIRARVGGGNIVTHLTGAPTAQLYSALRGVGATAGRVNSYGWRDLNRKPLPNDFDAAMLEAYQRGITPVILLEYEGSYQFLQPPQPVGSYLDWHAAGKAMAARFQPDGEWARENKIRGYGVKIFAAINEPDVQATIPRDAYRDALAGLADGVHSVNRALRVVPGGFATCNSHGDATLRGYGPAIAPLLEDGRLDGIDLHTYYNSRWFPLTRGREFSAQSCFDRVKAAMGLKRDVNFYATEYNIARSEEWTDPKLAARLFLTAFWDNVGVVRADGRSSATVIAFPWNLADAGEIEGPAYAMAVTKDPWAPDLRATVLRMVLRLAGDMTFTSLDPRGTGTFALESKDAVLLVWQNLKGWTDRPGPVWEVELPAWARIAELWGFDGLRRTIPVQGGKVAIRDLPGDETYMLRVPRPRK